MQGSEKVGGHQFPPPPSASRTAPVAKMPEAPQIAQELEKTGSSGQIGRITTLLGSALVPIGVGIVIATTNPVFLLVGVSGLALAGAGAMFASMKGVSKENLLRLAIVGLIAGAAAASVIVIGPTAAFKQVQDYLPAILSAVAMVPVIVDPKTIRKAKQKIQQVADTVIASGLGLFQQKLDWNAEVQSLDRDTYFKNDRLKQVDSLWLRLVALKEGMEKEIDKSSSEEAKANLHDLTPAMAKLRREHSELNRFLKIKENAETDGPALTYQKLRNQHEAFKQFSMAEVLLKDLKATPQVIALFDARNDIEDQFQNAKVGKALQRKQCLAWISQLEEFDIPENRTLVKEIQEAMPKEEP